MRLYKMQRAQIFIAFASCLVSCKPYNTTSPEPPGLGPDEHLLLHPRGEPSALLGLAVTPGDDGQLVIANARAPGCKVRIWDVPAQWNQHIVEDSGHVAVFGVGYEKIAALRAQYGNRLRIEATVSNTTELRADLKGPCGDRAITSVFVGSGERSLQHFTGSGGELHAAGGPISASVGGSNWENIEATLEWSAPQAWGFRTSNGNSPVDYIRITMPETIAAGTQLTPTIETHAPLWLIILYQDANGDYGVILPAAGTQPFRAGAGDKIDLKKIEFNNLPGRTEDNERILVYGFHEKLDFHDYRPRDGRLTQQEANDYARTLELRLQNLPLVRWTTTEFGYTIKAEQ